MIFINGNNLTIEEIYSIAHRQDEVKLSPDGENAIRKSRECLERILESGRAVYGINTGFGIFADRRIPADDSARLSRNLILSHAVATGDPFPSEVVRAAMLVRANTLSKGNSGVRLEVVQTLLDMLNRDVTPVVPSQGSLGSSGDLGPLSHMALVLTTDDKDLAEDSGWAYFNGELLSGKEAMSAAGIRRLILGPKEGLAINNGATFSAALAALAVYEAGYLADIADYSLAMSLEAMLGCESAFDARLHQARGQIGQIKTAEHVLSIIEGSNLVNKSGRVQDAYSLRCAPQVHGSVRDTIEFVEKIIQREVNAATDNPLLFEKEDAISGGNFHGEPIGLAMDYLGIAIAELGAISERRVFRLTDGNLNTGLPPMLVDSKEAAGLNSGLMMPQYTAASLVLENQTLAHPDSVHSLPTSGEQEDHNANATTATRHADRIIKNVQHILAIELFTAARALHLRLRQMAGERPGKGTEKMFMQIEIITPYRPGDAWWGPDIERLKKNIQSHTIDV